MSSKACFMWDVGKYVLNVLHSIIWCRCKLIKRYFATKTGASTTGGPTTHVAWHMDYWDDIMLFNRTKVCSKGVNLKHI